MFEIKLILLFLTLVHYSKPDECFSTFCNCSLTVITCKNFSSFEDLELDDSKNGVIWSEIVFIPSIKLQLSNHLDLSKLRFYENSLFSFSNIESIYAYSNVFKKIKLFNTDGKAVDNNNNISLRLNFMFSSITILPFQDINNADELTEYTKCEYNEKRNENYIFANLIIGELRFYQSEFPNTIAICPLLFSGTIIKDINFSILSGRARFRNVSFPMGTQKRSINCTVKTVIMSNNANNFVEEIDEKTLFNEYIFEKTEKISVNGNYLNYIDDNTLQKLKYLRVLTLENIQNPSIKPISIFQETKWLENLNKKRSTKSLEELDFNRIEDVEYFMEIFFILEINSVPGLLNEENVCFINKFPVNNLIIPLINDNNGSCTCSTYWLYRFYIITSGYFNLIPDIKIKACFSGILQQNLTIRIENCNINRRCLNEDSAKVNITTVSSSKSTTITQSSNRVTSNFRPIHNNSFKLFSIKFFTLLIIIILII